MQLPRYSQIHSNICFKLVIYKRKCVRKFYPFYCCTAVFSNGIKRENNASYIRPRSIGALVCVHSQTWCYLVTFRWQVRRKHDPSRNFGWVSSVFRRRRWATTRASTSTSSAHILSICEGFYISQHFHAPCLTRVHLMACIFQIDRLFEAVIFLTING